MPSGPGWESVLLTPLGFGMCQMEELRETMRKCWRPPPSMAKRQPTVALIHIGSVHLTATTKRALCMHSILSPSGVGRRPWSQSYGIVGRRPWSREVPRRRMWLTLSKRGRAEGQVIGLTSSHLGMPYSTCTGISLVSFHLLYQACTSIT